MHQDRIPTEEERRLFVQKLMESADRGTRRRAAIKTGINFAIGFTIIVTLSIVAAALAGCGGGGDGGGGSGAPSFVGPPGTPPVAVPPAAQAPGDCTIVLYGDSIAVDQDGALPAALPGWKVRNAALPGTGALEMQAWFQNQPRTEKYVAIEWGINDPLLGNNDVASPLRAMVAYARAEGRIPVLTGMVPTRNQPLIERQPAIVASENHAPYVGWDQTSGKTLDGLHPDTEWHDRIFGLLAQKLENLAPECMK